MSEQKFTKIIKFKAIVGGQKCEIECDKTLCISDYLKTIKKQLGFDSDAELKFTQGGIEILPTTKLENISKTVPIGVLKTHISQQNKTDTGASDINVPLQLDSEKYTLSEIHAMLPFFLLYFKLKDPSMFKLFVHSNENNSFANIVLQPKYFELTKILMRQSTDIVTARRKQSDKNKLIDCKIVIPDPQSLELLASQSGVEFNLDKRTYGPDGTMYFNSSNPLNNLLSELDIAKITMLQKYGYTYETAKEYYMRLNKDFNLTIEYLKANIPIETECELEHIDS